MPPRLPSLPHIGTSPLCFRPASKIFNSPLPAKSAANASTAAQKKQRNNAYALAQIQQRKNANKARQAELKEQREAEIGDPVQGVTTPFLESFDTVGASPQILQTSSTQTSSEGIKIERADDLILNHFLKPSELEEAIQHSYSLTEPIIEKVRDTVDPAKEQAEQQKHSEGHSRASIALARIVSMANASQRDKTRANIQRCIEKFGRHNTDGVLRPRPSASVDKSNVFEKTPRAGPDTGSSEVQIALLTAKIRVLADQLKKTNKDKVNKRNLRLLVHRRQKLLRYLRKKERGGDRWQHLVGTLGLTDGTWKGEISL